jgi:hypothetical protein
MRNLDSKIYLPRFYRFKFRFHSFFAETFSTVSVIGRHGHVAGQLNARVGSLARYERNNRKAEPQAAFSESRAPRYPTG